MQSKQQGGVASQPSSSTLPETIDDAEEGERVSQMLQRDSLVRGLGLVELVQRLIRAVDKNDPTAAVFPSDSTGGAVVVDRPPSNHVGSFCLFNMHA